MLKQILQKYVDQSVTIAVYNTKARSSRGMSVRVHEDALH